jgi:hypothetical protein
MKHPLNGELKRLVDEVVVGFKNYPEAIKEAEDRFGLGSDNPFHCLLQKEIRDIMLHQRLDQSGRQRLESIYGISREDQSELGD